MFLLNTSRSPPHRRGRRPCCLVDSAIHNDVPIGYLVSNLSVKWPVLCTAFFVNSGSFATSGSLYNIFNLKSLPPTGMCLFFQPRRHWPLSRLQSDY